MQSDCPICEKIFQSGNWLLENDHCVYIPKAKDIHPHRGMIVLKQHITSLMDMTDEQIAAHLRLAFEAQTLLQSKFQNQGLSLNWNFGPEAGQEFDHIVLEVFPRFSDEPYAKSGLDTFLNSEGNRLLSQQEVDELVSELENLLD